MGPPGFPGLVTPRHEAAPTSSIVRERKLLRVLPIEYGPVADPADGPGEPLVESLLLEPYPDEKLGLEDESATPEARYERRESAELAFFAALQHPPPPSAPR